MSAPATSRTGSNPKIRQRQTKVVATLGPASGTIDVIRELVAAGADVFIVGTSGLFHNHEDIAEAWKIMTADIAAALGAAA